MRTASLDLLEKSELSPVQARAILQVMESELATKADLQALQLATGADMRNGFHALELKVEAVRSDVVRWVFVCTFGQAAMLAGVVYFVLTYLRK